MQANEKRFKTFNARFVKDAARGSWLNILSDLSPSLTEACSKPGKHFPCPVHGGKDGFRLFKDAADTGGGICNTCGSFDDGFRTLMWANDWTFPETVEAVANSLRLKPGDVKNAPDIRTVKPVESKEARQKREFKDQKLREQMTQMWKTSFPLSEPASEPARLYFARRGLKLKYAISSPVLRFHPGTPYFHEGKKIGVFPAILAMVYGADGRPVTIHRTFIDLEGFKADVTHPKKCMPYPSDRSMHGCFIPLLDVAHLQGNLEGEKTAMGVTEGIETALAVIEASNGTLPVWALVSDKILEGFNPPEFVDELYIYGDQDANGAGKNSSINLKANLAEADVEVAGWLPSADHIPAGKSGIDWLDVYNLFGREAVPLPTYLKDPEKIGETQIAI